MKKQTKLGLVLAAAAVISVSVASLVSARGWVQDGADWYYVDNSGEYVTETIQSSGNNKFYLGEDGAMMKDYFLEDYNGNTYYFGNNGAMVTNTWVAIESSRVENQDEYVPDNYWYYFQASGKAMKGSSGNPKKTTVDGKKYLFNEYGQMCTGWITDGGKVVNTDEEENPFATAKYYAGGDNDGVLRSGWVTYYDGYDGADSYASEYTNLYFYFNTSNNTKTEGTKKINGRTYAFDSEGIMVSGWDAMKELNDFKDKVVYFSSEDDGHQVKKGWVYAVPTESMDKSAYDDDEEKYMYFNASGEIIADQFKKINGKYYVFNRTGIMKTGVVLWAPDTFELKNSAGTKIGDYHFIKTLDLDWATGEQVSKAGILRYDKEDNDYIQVNLDGQVVADPGVVLGTGNSALSDLQVKMHLFGSDGARKTGINNVEFSDDTYLLYTTASGDKGSGVNSKKYYTLGIQLKANADIRYGIYHTGSASNAVPTVGQVLGPQGNKNAADAALVDKTYRENLKAGIYQVLNTSGAIQKGQTSARKDADGNYWYIEKGTNALAGIWTVNVKESNTFSSSFKTKIVKIARQDVYDSDFVVVENNAYKFVAASTSEILSLTSEVLDKGAFMAAIGTNDEEEMNKITWMAYENGIDRFYFYPAEQFSAYAYQSDINDQSSKWIPFGVFDNSGKTVVKDATYNADSAENKSKFHGYEVTPNNDYFTNCYWTELK